MNEDNVEIGKTYRMKPGALDRRVVDIISYPAGGPFAQEYREVICELASGSRIGKQERVSLGWFAAAAQNEIPCR